VTSFCPCSLVFVFLLQYLEVNKSFKNIFQEEKAVEETKKEQQNYLVRVTKIEKQLEEARSSGEDSAKIEALESDMAGVSVAT